MSRTSEAGTDADTTVKPLYVRLEGAVVIYNPKKSSGRCSATKPIVAGKQ